MRLMRSAFAVLLALNPPCAAQPAPEARVTLPGPADAAWWVRPDMPWTRQALVVVLPEQGEAAAPEVAALLARGLAGLLLPPADERGPGQARAGAAAGAAAGFGAGRLGFLAVGAAALGALQGAEGRPLVMIEPACEALEVPRPGPLLVLAGAAAAAACPPLPPWAGLERQALAGSIGDPVVLQAAAAAAADWLCRRLAPCAEAMR